MEYFLKVLADKMPFAARPVSQELLDEEAKKEQDDEMRNTNPYTYEYMIKNNMLGCRKYARRIDYFHFGKFI